MTNPIVEQLTQQLDPESITPEQHPVGILGLSANSANKPEQSPLLGSAPAGEQEQPLGFVSLVVMGD